MKINDLLWKRTEDKNGKARWEKIGALIDKEGKKSVKLDLIPVSSDSSDSLSSASRWGDRGEKDRDGWLVVSEKKDKKENPD